MKVRWLILQTLLCWEHSMDKGIKVMALLREIRYFDMHKNFFLL